MNGFEHAPHAVAIRDEAWCVLGQHHAARRLGLEPGPIPGGWIAGTNWVAGIVAVYASLFGIGKVIFGEVALGAGLLALATAAFLWIGRSFRAEAA